MGSLLKPKSTRVVKAQPPISQSRRKPAISKPSKLPTATPSPRAADERQRRTEAILKAARTIKPAAQSQDHGLTLVALLMDIRHRLAVIRSVTYTASVALRFHRADIDADVGITLQRCAGDELDRQVERLDDLLKMLGVDQERLDDSYRRLTGFRGTQSSDSGVSS
jgi:hypothetical protein